MTEMDDPQQPQQPVEAHLADGTVLQFPAGTSNDVVQTAVKRQLAGQPHPQAAAAGTSDNPALKMALPKTGNDPNATWWDKAKEFGKETAIDMIPLYGVWRHTGLDAPSTAALAAGIATGGAGLLPAAAAAAGAGGTTRLAQQQVEQGAHVPTGEDLKAAGGEAAVQGGLELGGGLLTKAAAPVGKFLYGKALAPSKTLQREFPDIVDTGLREGMNVTPKGAQQAREAIQASAGKTRDILAAAAPDAAPVQANEVAPAFRPVWKDIRAQEAIGKDMTADRASTIARAKRVAESFGGTPGSPAVPERTVPIAPSPNAAGAAPAMESGDQAVLRARAQLGPMADLIPSHMFAPAGNEARVAQELGSLAQTIPRRLIADAPAASEPLRAVIPGRPALPADPGGIGLLEAQTRKQTAQDAAQAAYKKRALGQSVNDLEDLTDQQLAKAYQTAIEQRVPEVAAQNKNTQSLIGISRALDDAELRPHVLGWLMGMAGGGAAGAGAAAKHIVFTSPRALGRTGIVLDRLGSVEGNIPANLGRELISAIQADRQPRVPIPLAPTTNQEQPSDERPSAPAVTPLRLPIPLRY